MMAVYSAGIHEHCKTCFNANCTIEPDGLGSNSCDSINCPAGCGLRFHRCKQLSHKDICVSETVPCLFSTYGCEKLIRRAKMSEHMIECPAYVVNAIGSDIRRDEYDSHVSLHHDVGGFSRKEIEGHCPFVWYGCKFKYTRLSPKNQPNSTLVQSTIFKGQSFTINEEEQMPKNGSEETDQSSLPTFEEFANLNLNSNTNIAQFCETVSPTSYQPIEPTERQYAKLQRTLSTCDTDGPLGILGLPVEVIVKIFTNLDSYSLNNVSLTCHILREICSTLLSSKGMAIPEASYVKETSEYGESGWELSRLRWKFSVCSSSVPEWTYNGDLCLLQHMQVCPFYPRKKEEFSYPDEIEGHCPLASYGCNFTYSRLSPPKEPNTPLAQRNRSDGESFTANGQISNNTSKETNKSHVRCSLNPPWTYHGDLCLLKHLQECSFNSRDNLSVHTEPFKLPEVPVK